jgi:NAD(P)-dependent dehydrogenase (short-subunit alcohol dehydrogenase family)
VDVDAMRLDNLIRFLRGNTVAVPADSSDAGAVRQALQQVEKALGPVDILVNATEDRCPRASSRWTRMHGGARWRATSTARSTGATPSCPA